MRIQSSERPEHSMSLKDVASRCNDSCAPRPTLTDVLRSIWSKFFPHPNASHHLPPYQATTSRASWFGRRWQAPLGLLPSACKMTASDARVGQHCFREAQSSELGFTKSIHREKGASQQWAVILNSKGTEKETGASKRLCAQPSSTDLV